MRDGNECAHNRSEPVTKPVLHAEGFKCLSSPPDCVLIKTKAVALNPTDWKYIDFISIRGATVGCDYAGVIEEIGAEVDPAHGLQVGDRVAGFNHGCKSILRFFL